MAALTILVPDVLAEVPNIPSFVAERQLLRATRQFAEHTRAWRANITITTTANADTVNLTSLLPTSTELVDIISMKNASGAAPVEPRTFSWLDTNRADWRTETDIAATSFVLSSNNVLRLVPTPSATGTRYNTRVAVKPLLTATTIDDMLVNKYSEELIHGALAYLFLIPQKPWTDGAMAQYHQAMFMNSFAGARAEAADEFQTGVPRTVKYGGL